MLTLFKLAKPVSRKHQRLRRFGLKVIRSVQDFKDSYDQIYLNYIQVIKFVNWSFHLIHF